jgi:5-methylcytosine-specific restriction protein B
MSDNLVEDSPEFWRKESKHTLSSFPLNSILYGPPGTGKTYRALQYALGLALHQSHQSNSNLDLTHKSQILHQFQENGQIVVVTFHAGYSYEDFVQGLRPNVQAGTLLFEKKEGVFRQIVDRARQNYEAFTQQQKKLPPPFEDLLNLFLSQTLDPETEEIEIPLDSNHRIFKSLIIYDIREDALLYRRRTKNDIIKEEERVLTFRKLKALYEGQKIKEAINEKYYQTLIEALQKHKHPSSVLEEKRELKNFILVIDEINRGNLSAVFGELITLIETDKRLGAKNEMRLTLASGDEMSIPPNLYILGTMNTADKSLTWLDIAMRRRFEFEAVLPDSNLIKNLKVRQVFETLNKILYEEKQGSDLLIGHAFLMGKDEESMITVFNQQIIPLLEEYFSNRPEKVRQILLKLGFKMTQDDYQLRVISF